MPLGDVPALANAILELLSDEEKARCMGAEARRVAAESFDQRKVFRAIEAEYAQLLSRRNIPVPSRGESRAKQEDELAENHAGTSLA